MTLSFFDYFVKKIRQLAGIFWAKKLLVLKYFLDLIAPCSLKNNNNKNNNNNNRKNSKTKKKQNKYSTENIRKKTMPTSKNCATIYAHVSRINDTNVDSE